MQDIDDDADDGAAMLLMTDGWYGMRYMEDGVDDGKMAGA